MDVATYSPLALAYIGDGIYDLVIRSIVVGKGNTKASRLHQTTSHLVKAHAQATMMETLTPMLTEDERKFTAEAEMPSLRPWQKTQLCQIIAVPPALKH